MSADADLKAAAAYMDRAANQKRIDAQQVRKDISEAEQRIQREIDELEDERRNAAVEASAGTDSTARQTMLNQRMQENSKLIDDLKHKLQELRAEKEQELHQMADQERYFKQQASDIRNQAANA